MYNVIFDIVGIALLGIILYKQNRSMSSFHVSQKLFNVLIITNILVLVFDGFTYLFKNTGPLNSYFFHLTSNIIYFICVPLPCFFWALYSEYLINKDVVKLKITSCYLVIPVFINFILCIINIFIPVYFSINKGNEYFRNGNMFLISAGLSYIYLLYTFVFIIINRKKAAKSEYLPMLTFIIIPFVISLYQNLFEGYSILWLSTAFSILIVYINIQNSELSMDYLTRLYNRRELNNYAALKLKKNINKDALIYGLMIDVDGFKMINDRFGHVIGDEALTATGAILRKSVHKTDFVARYGGDEFFIISEVNNNRDIEVLIKRILLNAEEFNIDSGKPYEINFSIGYAAYNSDIHPTVERFFHDIDQKMYADKNSKK